MDAVVVSADSYRVDVIIRDYSGAGLLDDALQLSWRLRGEREWHVNVLEPTSEPAVFSAFIPGNSSGQAIEYYLSAEDHTGRQESLPRTAPEGFYTFMIE